VVWGFDLFVFIQKDHTLAQKSDFKLGGGGSHL
jgi:hypothetical protein